MSQLSLGIKTQPKAKKTRERSPEFLDFLAELRREKEQATAIAREMFGDDVGDLARLPNDKFIPVLQEFHRRAGTKIRPLRDTAQTPMKVTPYRPWSIERKQRNRVQKLKTRILKKYSFPGLWIEAMQGKLLDMPQYFGVCPLPQSVNQCQLYLADLIQNPAKLKEMEIREAEYQQYQRYLATQSKEAV